MRQVKANTGEVFTVHTNDISHWAQIKHHRNEELGHEYAVYAESGQIASMRYIKDFPEPGIITIHDLSVEPGHQLREVASALLIQLHINFPGYLVNPGHPSQEGLSFIKHLMEKEPQVKASLTFFPEVQEQLDEGS